MFAGSNLQMDIERANTAWTTADAKLSAQGLDGPRSSAVHAAESIVREANSQNESLTVIALQKGIRRFLRLKPTGPRFESVWLAMSVHARSCLLLAVMPHMPATPQAADKTPLLPEIDVEQLAGTASAFLELVETVSDLDLIDLYASDCDFVQQLMRRRLVQLPMQRKLEFAMVQGGKYVGEVMQVLLPVKQPQMKCLFNTLTSTRFLIYNETFTPCPQRMQVSLVYQRCQVQGQYVVNINTFQVT